MKRLLMIAALVSLTHTAFAEGITPYSCEAKANPDRGFAVDLRPIIFADSTMQIDGSRPSPAFPVQSMLVTLNQPGGKEIIGTIMQYVGSPELSGITDPTIVDSFQKYFKETDEGEIAVYRFFAGGKQIGGTFWYDEHATKCLP